MAYLTVGKLRELLEGVPDDLDVLIQDDYFLMNVWESGAGSTTAVYRDDGEIESDIYTECVTLSGATIRKAFVINL